MPMRVVWAVLGCLLVASLSACVPVYCVQPVGETPLDISAQRAQWEGSWISPDGKIAVFVSIVDPKAGLLSLNWIDATKDGESAAMRSDVVWLRASDGWVFANVPVSLHGQIADSSPPADAPDPNAPASAYLWARIKRNGRLLLIWHPDAKRFQTLIEQGVFSGVREKGHRYWLLEPLTSAQIKAMAGGELPAVPFDWDNPLILIRHSD